MSYTNGRYARLTEEEIARQEAVLAPMRSAHETELFDLGIIQRLMGSTAMSNQIGGERSALTEGTTLYPARSNTKKLPARLLHTVGRDTALSPYFEDREWNIGREALSLPGPYTQSYMLGVARTDMVGHGVAQRSRYTAGIQLGAPAQGMLGMQEFLPVRDVEEADLVTIARQLMEIQFEAIDNELEIIDPATLTQGLGEPGFIYD